MPKEMTTAEAITQLKKPGDKIHFINEKGQRSSIVLLDMNAIEESCKRDLKFAAERVKDETFNALQMEVVRVLANEPRVSEYEKVAKDLTELLQDAYDQVGEPQRGRGNAFYSHCKYINSEWCGKAQTFMVEVKKLHMFLKDLEALRS